VAVAGCTGCVTSGLQTFTSRGVIRSAQTRRTYRRKAVRLTGTPVVRVSRSHTVATWLVRKPSRISSRYQSKSPHLADCRTGSTRVGRALFTNSIHQVASDHPLAWLEPGSLAHADVLPKGCGTSPGSGRSGGSPPGVPMREHLRDLGHAGLPPRHPDASSDESGHRED